MTRVLMAWLTVLVTLPICAGAQPDTDGISSGTTSSISTPTPTKAKRLEDPGTVSVAGPVDGSAEATCTLRAWNGNGPRKGLKGTLTARVIDLAAGVEVQQFAPRRLRTKRNGEATLAYSVDGAGQGAVLAVLIVEVDLRGGKRVTKASLTCGFA